MASAAIPLSASSQCSFRNAILFTDPTSAITATVPNSKYTDAECEAQVTDITYSFTNYHKPKITRQCLYLNGKLVEWIRFVYS
jgi:hypothetical protein